MSTSEQDRILLVDDNSILRETLAHWLRASGHEVLTASTGERAFLILREWNRPVGWLYARAELPGLVDGWILADEYHDTHPGRAVVLSASDVRPSTGSYIILKQPTPTAIFESIRQAITARATAVASARAGSDDMRRAA